MVWDQAAYDRRREEARRRKAEERRLRKIDRESKLSGLLADFQDSPNKAGKKVPLYADGRGMPIHGHNGLSINDFDRGFTFKCDLTIGHFSQSRYSGSGSVYLKDSQGGEYSIDSDKFVKATKHFPVNNGVISGEWGFSKTGDYFSLEPVV
jgi:hypothetical protein